MVVVWINRALATVVTPLEYTIRVRLLAVVSSRVEAVLVRLHEVKFRAHWILSTMVAVSIAVTEWVMSVVYCGHENRLEMSDAATAHVAQVNVVFKNTSEHVGLVETRGIICAGL